MPETDDMATLQNQLAADAANDIPPFGAESVRMAAALGRSATSVLVKQIEIRSPASFLALEALRAADVAAYQALSVGTRSAIYASALRSSAFFNAWGMPGVQLTDTANALASLGVDAVAALAPLLEDERPAPLAGSKDATASSAYGNRVRDYAWVLISEILGRRYSYPKSPRARDEEIDKLRAHLRRRQE